MGSIPIISYPIFFNQVVFGSLVFLYDPIHQSLSKIFHQKNQIYPSLLYYTYTH